MPPKPSSAELADAVASAIEKRDWTELEALALSVLRRAPFTDSTTAAWAMLALVAVQQARAEKRDARRLAALGGEA